MTDVPEAPSLPKDVTTKQPYVSDFLGHLRLSHYTLIVVCLVMVLAVLSRDPTRTERAAHDVEAIENLALSAQVIAALLPAHERAWREGLLEEDSFYLTAQFSGLGYQTFAGPMHPPAIYSDYLDECLKERLQIDSLRDFAHFWDRLDAEAHVIHQGQVAAAGRGLLLAQPLREDDRDGTMYRLADLSTSRPVIESVILQVLDGELRQVEEADDQGSYAQPSHRSKSDEQRLRAKVAQGIDQELESKVTLYDATTDEWLDESRNLPLHLYDVGFFADQAILVGTSHRFLCGWQVRPDGEEGWELNELFLVDVLQVLRDAYPQSEYAIEVEEWEPEWQVVDAAIVGDKFRFLLYTDEVGLIFWEGHGDYQKRNFVQAHGFLTKWSDNAHLSPDAAYWCSFGGDKFVMAPWGETESSGWTRQFESDLRDVQWVTPTGMLAMTVNGRASLCDVIANRVASSLEFDANVFFDRVDPVTQRIYVDAVRGGRWPKVAKNLTLMLVDPQAMTPPMPADVIRAQPDGLILALRLTYSPFVLLDDKQQIETVYVPVQGRTTNVDLQQEIARRANRSWAGGTFAQTFPVLNDLSEPLKAMPLGELRAHLNTERFKERKPIELIGSLSIPGGSIYVWGVIVLLAVQFHFWLLTDRFRRRKLPRNEISAYPWLAIDDFWMARAAFILTLVVLPTLTVAFLCGNQWYERWWYDEPLKSVGWWSVGAVGLSLVISALSLMEWRLWWKGVGHSGWG